MTSAAAWKCSSSTCVTSGCKRPNADASIAGPSAASRPGTSPARSRTVFRYCSRESSRIGEGPGSMVLASHVNGSPGPADPEPEPPLLELPLVPFVPSAGDLPSSLPRLPMHADSASATASRPTLPWDLNCSIDDVVIQDSARG